MIGTLAFSIVSLALALSPIFLIVSDFGPMNVMLQDSHCSAKSAFSDKNPYPGCMASTSAISAALKIRSSQITHYLRRTMHIASSAN